MDEARRVLERLQRIETLKNARAEPAVLLVELRALVAEGEAWLAAEPTGARAAAGVDFGAERARRALAMLEEKLGDAVAGAGPDEGAVAGTRV